MHTETTFAFATENTGRENDVPELDLLDLCAENRTPYLAFDLDDGEVWIDSVHQSETGVPANVWHGQVRRYHLPVDVDAAAFTRRLNAGEWDALFTALRAGYECVWNGSNWVAQLSPEADAADEELRRLLEDANEKLRLPAGAGLYEADAWLAALTDADLGLTAETTDVELEQMARAQEAEALREHAKLLGTLGVLEDRRQALADAAEEA